MKRPFRVWMTGCAAVVMAGLGGVGNVGGKGSTTHGAVLRQASRYGVGETVQRLHDHAAQHGLTVFARLDTRLDARPWSTLPAAGSVIVFRTASGGTPVLMDGPADGPQLPLGVQVQLAADGHTEVLSAANDWDLPPELADGLDALPRLIADAVA